MEVREFLLLTHLATGASPSLARKVCQALAAGANPITDTLVMVAPARMQARLSQWLADARNTQRWQLLCREPYLTITDELYPERLRMIEQPPLVLFYRGRLELLQLTALGIVGARSAGEYTAQSLQQIMPSLPRNLVIVSGLAKGADGTAHEYALANGLPPVGVIATGLDRCYPRHNQPLQNQVAQNGLLLSEYPPGTASMPYRFVARNRIIAGLSHTLLVTEARHKSGSLITATMGLETGRTICVLPNRIDAPLGVGPNELIQQGATLIQRTPDLVAELRYFD